MKYILLFIVLSLNMQSLFAESSSNITINSSEIFEFPKSIEVLDSKNNVIQSITSDEEFTALSLKKESFEKIFNDDIEEIVINAFPVAPGENKQVILHRTQTPFREGTIWIRKTKDDEILEKKIIPVFFTGKITGAENSKVYLFYSDDMMYSIITQEGRDNFSISPLMKNSKQENPHLLISQKSSMISEDSNPFLDLHTDEIDDSAIIEELLKYADMPQTNDLLQANIIIEATNDYYKIFNDYEKAATYISAVMTLTSQLFEENILISIFIPTVIIHESFVSDPYNTTKQIYERLYQMPGIWRNNTVSRALVCLFTDIDYQQSSGGGRVGGISMGLGTLCKRNNGYVVLGIKGHYKYPTTNYTWDVSVSAHELGHAFGSPHTHNCAFKPNMIDTCITRNLPQAGSDGCLTGTPIPRPGTIMSYCHLTNATRSVALYFHERVKPVIRGRAENSACIQSAKDPTIILLEPGGGDVYFPGDNIKIRWASSKVEYVAIKYSLDNGINWEYLEQYADAKTGEFSWLIPDVISTEFLIYIHDSYNPEINDSTAYALTIGLPVLAINTPEKDIRIGQNEIYRIKWEQNFLNYFKVELLTQEGGEWTEIASGLTNNYYDWNVPDIESSYCKIRISSEIKGNTYTTESDVFAIGKEWVTIIAPKPDDILCAGETFDIKWESDFVSDLYLQYSTNGGDNWRHVKLGYIDGLSGIYTWKVSSSVLGNTILQFSAFDNKKIILAKSDNPFVIDNCAIDVKDTETYENKLNILEIVPNPTDNNAKVSFEYLLNNIQPVEIFMIDAKGGLIMNFEHNNSFTFGKNIIELDMPNVAQGNYYLIIKSGNTRTSSMIQIVK